MPLFHQFKKYWPSAAERRAAAKRWWKKLRRPSVFYAGSLVVHVALGLALLPLVVEEPEVANIEPPLDTLLDTELQDFQVGAALLRAGQLNTATIQLVQPPSQRFKLYDESPVFEDAGGGTLAESDFPRFGGFGDFENAMKGDGVHQGGDGGVGVGVGSSQAAGNGGGADGFNGRGRGRLDDLDGALVESERAVAAALSWLARHQNEDGSWSLGQFNQHCHDEHCADAGQIESTAAATALAILPFLAADQTPTSQGPYQNVIGRGVDWLVAQQGPDGNLAGKSEYLMYIHGIATLTVCEAFHMTGDERLGVAAERAIRFIERAQNLTTGGWQYQPGDRGDTSVTGWQVLALYSGQLAGVAIEPNCPRKATDWFRDVAQGQQAGLCSYVPGSPVTPNMTAVGLLSRRGLGFLRDDPAQVEATDYLLARNADEAVLKNSYCCFFATQIMQGRLDQRSEAWNENVRRHLLATQFKTGCQAGSWYPENPGELWTPKGGRLMTTSLAALTLEISHHYLPIFKPGPPEVARRPELRPAPPADSRTR